MSNETNYKNNRDERTERAPLQETKRESNVKNNREIHSHHKTESLHNEKQKERQSVLHHTPVPLNQVTNWIPSEYDADTMTQSFMTRSEQLHGMSEHYGKANNNNTTLTKESIHTREKLWEHHKSHKFALPISTDVNRKSILPTEIPSLTNKSDVIKSVREQPIVSNFSQHRVTINKVESTQHLNNKHKSNTSNNIVENDKHLHQHQHQHQHQYEYTNRFTTKGNYKNVTNKSKSINSTTNVTSTRPSKNNPGISGFASRNDVLGLRRNVDDHVFLHTNVMHVHRHRPSHPNLPPQPLQPPPPPFSSSLHSSSAVPPLYHLPPTYGQSSQSSNIVMKNDTSSIVNKRETAKTYASENNLYDNNQEHHLHRIEPRTTTSRKVEQEYETEEEQQGDDKNERVTQIYERSLSKIPPPLPSSTLSVLLGTNNTTTTTSVTPSASQTDLGQLSESPNEHYPPRQHYHVRFLSVSTMSIPGLLSNCTSPTVLSTRSFDLQGQLSTQSQQSYKSTETKRTNKSEYELEEEQQEELLLLEEQQRQQQEQQYQKFYPWLTPLTASSNNACTPFSAETKSLLVSSDALPKPLPSGNDTRSEHTTPVPFAHTNLLEPTRTHSRQANINKMSSSRTHETQDNNTTISLSAISKEKNNNAKKTNRYVIHKYGQLSNATITTKNNENSIISSNNSNNSNSNNSRERRKIASDKHGPRNKVNTSNSSNESYSTGRVMYKEIKQAELEEYEREWEEEEEEEEEQEEEEEEEKEYEILLEQASSHSGKLTKTPFSTSLNISTLEDAIAAVMESAKLAKMQYINNINNNNNNSETNHRLEEQEKKYVANVTLPQPHKLPVVISPSLPSTLPCSVSVFGLFAMLERATRFEEFASLRRRYGPLLECFLDEVASHLHNGHIHCSAHVLHSHACLMHILSSPTSAEKVGEEFYSDPTNAWPLHMLYLICCFYVTVQQTKSHDLFKAFQCNRSGLLTLGKGIFAALTIALSSSVRDLAQRTAEVYLAAFYVGVVMRSAQQSLERHLEFASHRNFALLLVNIPIFTLRQLIDQLNRSRCVHLYNYTTPQQIQHQHHHHHTPYHHYSREQQHFCNTTSSSNSTNRKCPIRPYSTIEISRVISSRSAIVCGHPLDLIKLDIVLTRYADFNGVKIHKDYIPATAPENSMYYNKSMANELLHYWDSEGISFNPTELHTQLYSPVDGEVWTRESVPGEALFTQKIAEAVMFRNQDLTYSLQHLQNNDVLLDFSLHTLSVGPLIAWSHKQSRVLSLPANRKEGSVLPPPRRGTYTRSLRNTLHKLAIINDVIRTLELSRNGISTTTTDSSNTKPCNEKKCFVELYTSFVELGYLRLVNETDNENEKQRVMEQTCEGGVHHQQSNSKDSVVREEKQDWKNDESDAKNENINDCHLHDKQTEIGNVDNLDAKSNFKKLMLTNTRLVNESLSIKDANMSTSEMQSNSHTGPTSSSSVTQNTTSIGNLCNKNKSIEENNNKNNNIPYTSSPIIHDTNEEHNSPSNKSADVSENTKPNHSVAHVKLQDKDDLLLQQIKQEASKQYTTSFTTTIVTNNTLANSPRVWFNESADNNNTTNNTSRCALSRKMPIQSISSNDLFLSGADRTSATNVETGNASPLHISISHNITNRDSNVSTNNNNDNNTNTSANPYNDAITSFATPIVCSIHASNNTCSESKVKSNNSAAVFLLPSIGATANRSQTTYPASNLSTSPVHQFSDADSREGILPQHGMFSFNARSDVHDRVTTSSEASRLPSSFNTPAMATIPIYKTRNSKLQITQGVTKTAMSAIPHHESSQSSPNNSLGNIYTNKTKHDARRTIFSASLTSDNTQQSHYEPRVFASSLSNDKITESNSNSDSGNRNVNPNDEADIVKRDKVIIRNGAELIQNRWNDSNDINNNTNNTNNNNNNIINSALESEQTCVLQTTPRYAEDGIAGEEYVIKRNIQYTDVINVYQVSPLIKYYEMQFGCVMREDAIHFMALLRAKTNIDFPLYALLLCPTVFALLEL